MDPKRIVEMWNIVYPIGTPVVYWPIREEDGTLGGEPFRGLTRSEAWLLDSGIAMVQVAGKAGGLSIDHVIPDSALMWLYGPHVGLASRTIYAVLQNPKSARVIKVPFGHVPHDGHDFWRCENLLQQMPEWRDRLSEVAQRFPWWAPFLRDWTKMVASLDDGGRPTRRTHRLVFVLDRESQKIRAGGTEDGRSSI